MDLCKRGTHLGAAILAAGLSLAGSPAIGIATAGASPNDATPNNVSPAGSASAPSGRGPARSAAAAASAPASGNSHATMAQQRQTQALAPRRTVVAAIKPVAPPVVTTVAATMKTVSAAAPAIDSTAAVVMDTAANWLSGLPASPINELVQGALLLVRRSTTPAATVRTVAATTSAQPFTLDFTNSFTTISGTVAAGTVTVNGHTWVADPVTHLYTTTVDLATQWRGYYSVMKSGQGSTLNDIQRLAGNAEAVFENTRLKGATQSQLSTDRQDVQRSLDAIYAAMAIAGVDPNSTFTQQQYIAVENALQSNPTLEELAVQGHGLNNSGISRYAGYTNDFQTGVDGQTLYVGGGLNDNANALARFFDDNILTHMPFPTVVNRGTLWQLNQNGNRESTVADAVTALNAGLTTTYTTRDFLQPPQLVNKTTYQLTRAGKSFSFVLAPNTFVDLQGQPMTYSATTDTGAALPSWLTFDPLTRQFSGTAPATRQTLIVLVRATNASGLHTTEGFAVVTR